MDFEKVSRVQYVSEASVCAVNPRTIAADFQGFHYVVGRTHHAALHGWGIASGLEVGGAMGQPLITVNPGVAVDRKGQLIVLAANGRANIGDPPQGVIQTAPPPVPLNTAPFADMEVYVTIQYVENAVAGDDAMPCGKLELTPWLRLQPVNGFQDSDELVILAIARIDAAGNLALLRAREAGMAQGRQLVDQSVHELQVRMPTEVGGGVADVTTGTLGPSAAGGLRIAVPRAGDRIAFEAANAGNFAVLDVRADRLVLAGDLVTPGRVDGRDVSGDGQKLDSHIAIVAGNPHGTSAAQVGALSIQGGTLFGSLNLNSALTKSNAAGQQVVLLTDSSNQGGFFQTNTAAGQPAVRLTTSSGSQAGYQALYNAAGQETITLSAFAGGFIQTRNAANKPAVRLTTGGDAGYLNIYNGAGQEIVRLTDAASAGFLETRTAANAPAIRLTTTGGSQAGYLAAFNPSGNETITLSAFSSGFIQTRNAANKPAVRLTTAGESGYLNTFNGAGQEIVRISTTSNGGYLSTFNAAGKEVVQLTIGGDSGYIRVNNGAGQAASVVATTTEGSGFIETQTKSLKPGVRLTTVGGGDNGSVKVYGADGNVKLWLDGTGSKNFVMPHPEDPSKDIIYAALEGPEAAAYLRGRARLSSGYCAIQFPDHFRLVVLPESLTFQLTPRAACSQGLALTEHSAEGFIVRELGNGVGDYEFDYFVAGVRRGLDHFSPVVPRGHSAFGSPSEDAPSEPSSSPQSLTPAVASVQADEITLDDSPASSPDSVEPPASPDSPLTEPSVAPTPEADAANARLPAADTPFQQPRDPDCGCVSRAPAPSPSQENDGDQGEEEGGPFLRERAFLEQRVMVLRPHSERPRSQGPSIEAMTESAVDVRAGELLAERDALLESAQEAGERLGLEAAPRLAGGESPRMPVSAKFRQRTVDEYRERKRAAMIQSLPTADMAESVQPPEAPREAPANNWIPIGPSVVRQGQGANRPAVSGRVAGLAVAPGGQRVYAASANGGVWRSDNAGLTWRSTMDAWDLNPQLQAADSLACGAIAIDRANPDRIYVGTGEGDTVWLNSQGAIVGSSAFWGVGPIRSDDGGVSWIREETAPASPTLQGAAFYRLAVDPADRERVIGASTVGLYRREPDGASGFHWSRKLAGVFTSVVASRKNNVTIFYAARHGGGVVQSTDGHTWTATPGFPASGVGRVGLAVQANNPDVVYALIARNTNDHLLGVWRFDRALFSWRQVAGAPSQLFGADLSRRGQGSYDLAIAVDPLNVNRIYLGGSTQLANNQWSGSLYRGFVQSSGSGSSVSYSMTSTYIGDNVHADLHALEFTPGNSNQLWVGCDGGVFFSNSALGSPQFESRNTGLTTLTMNHLAIHPTEDSVLFCGTQDNGTARYTGEEAWLHSVWGDGGFPVIHPLNPYQILATYVAASINRATDGGKGYQSWSSVSVPVESNERTLFYAPLVGLTNPQNSAEAGLVAFGSIRPWISTTFGGGWRSLPNGNLAQDRLDSAIRSLCFAAGNKLYAGTELGGVYRLQKIGASWTRTRLDDISVGGQSPHSGPVTDIVVDLADTSGDSIYIALGGVGDFRHVWHFDGTRWTPRSGPSLSADQRLLDVQHNALVVDPGNPSHIYVGADIGIWRSTDSGETWTPFSFGLPDAAVLDLKLHPKRRLLWAATHGRGVFEYALDSDTALPVELYVRRTQLDRGKHPPEANLPDPTNPGSLVDRRRSPDIKIDSPSLSGVYQTPGKELTFFQFVDLLSDDGRLATRSTGQPPIVNRVFVQVHNRGVQLADGVRVMLLLAKASPAIPPLPLNYEQNVRAGIPLNTPQWKTVGIQELGQLQVGAPGIAAFELSSSLLPSAGSIPGNGSHCLLALIHGASDPFTSQESNVDALILSERKSAMTVASVFPLT